MSIFSKYSPISVALSPNAERDDLWLVLKLIFSGWKNSQAILELENKFKEYFKTSRAFSFSSGRVGLYAILKGLSFLKGQSLKNDKNEIILQAYTTIALPNAIKWAGFKPIYVDIKENTYNIDPDKIEAKINAKTKAVIVQHTFGIPAEMDKISALCKKHRLFLIEDCAHSLGAEFHGQKVGTFGDAAFFSFGRDKIISSVSGGMVIANNGSLAVKISEYRESLPYPPLFWIFQRLIHPLVFACALPIYYFFNLGQVKIYLSQKFGLITRAYDSREKEGLRPAENYKLPNALAALALNQFRKIERFNEHRRNLAKIYEQKIKNDLVKKPDLADNVKPTPLYYTIQTPNRDKILKIAQENHIILGNWFPDALGPENIDLKKFDYRKGECPIAEKAGSQSLNLPTNIKTSEKDAEKIIELINKI